MTTEKPFEHSRAKTAFSVGIGGYAAGWIGVCIFVQQAFGLDIPALLLFLVLTIPLIVAMRMRRRWPVLSGREYAYLLSLIILVLLGCVFVIQNWYVQGIDLQHAQDLKFDELMQNAKEDPQYLHVEFSITNHKGRYIISGSVASQTDLKHLQAMCKQYGFQRYLTDVVVLNASQSQADLPTGAK
jgi:hypothetical protein